MCREVSKVDLGWYQWHCHHLGHTSAEENARERMWWNENFFEYFRGGETLGKWTESLRQSWKRQITESLRDWTWSEGIGQMWQHLTLKSDMSRWNDQPGEITLGQDGRCAGGEGTWGQESALESVRGRFETESLGLSLLTQYATLGLSLHLWRSDALKALVYLFGRDFLGSQHFHPAVSVRTVQSGQDSAPFGWNLPLVDVNDVDHAKYVLCQRPLERMTGKPGPRYPKVIKCPKCCFCVCAPVLTCVFW